MKHDSLWILGINSNVHDSSVTLLRDGEMVFAIEEERLNRRKHYNGSPTRALREALAVGEIDYGDLDSIVIPWRFHRYWRYTFFHNFLRLPRRPALHTHAMVEATNLYLRYWSEFRAFARKTRTITYDHHYCHAASAFFLSPFDEAALLCYDARGEDVSTTWHIGEGTTLRTIERIGVPDSLGHLYAQVTHYLGFGDNDEYKVMGLAPYGTPRFSDLFDRALTLLPEGRYRISRRFMDYYRGFSKELLSLGPPRGREEPLTDFHRDVATSLQRAFERVALHMAAYLRKATGKRYLGIAGGCGLNAVANGRIAREAGFDDVFVQPAASDQGLSLGAAYVRWCVDLGRPRPAPMIRADLGREVTTAEIDEALTLFQIEHRVVEDPSLCAAKLIAAGRVIGWVNGRGEFGPRALGQRSILADPRDPEMRDRVNGKIKMREGFRPFAPAVMVERVGQVFETERELPFMVFVYNVRPEWRERLPAITHVDGSARIQTVNAGHHPEYHAIIRHFDAMTGVPVILNTSFNLQGEPMVERAQDAVRTFYSSGIDALFLKDRLIVKRPEYLAEAGLSP